MLTSAMNRSGGAQNLASVITGSYDADGKPLLEILELPNSSTQQGCSIGVLSPCGVVIAGLELLFLDGRTGNVI